MLPAQGPKDPEEPNEGEPAEKPAGNSNRPLTERSELDYSRSKARKARKQRRRREARKDEPR